MFHAAAVATAAADPANNDSTNPDSSGEDSSDSEDEQQQHQQPSTSAADELEVCLFASSSPITIASEVKVCDGLCGFCSTVHSVSPELLGFRMVNWTRACVFPDCYYSLVRQGSMTSDL